MMECSYWRTRKKKDCIACTEHILRIVVIFQDCRWPAVDVWKQTTADCFS